MAVTLDGVGVDVPQDFLPTVLNESFEQSLIGQVVPSQAMNLGGSVQYVYDGGIEVGLVSEGQAKPESNFATSQRTITTAKVATIVVVSKEAAMVNPAQMLDNMQADLRNSISRAVDSLVIHGRDPRGNAYTGDNLSIAGAGTEANVVTLDALTPTELGDALEAAYDAAGENGDPNAWLFDPRLRSRLTRAVQDVERGLPDLRGGASVVAGLPAYYGRGVTGRTSQAAETGVRGILGDFSKVRYGFVEQLSLSRSTEATVGGVSMFETNQIAYLVEAILGWTVLDQAAFTLLRDPAPAG